MLKPTGILWHKAIKSRSAVDVASVFIHLVRKNRDIQSFLVCPDNYFVKNRNCFLSTALTNKVNRKSIAIYAITLKYFKPGHTFMPADSFHHRIGQEMRKKKRLEDFQDFVDIVLSNLSIEDTCIKKYNRN